jgi:5-methylcytosine-specific restriction endonuclease McrA
MKAKLRQDRAQLLATARSVAERLRLNCKGTRLRVRIPRSASATDTDGWRAILGDLGKGQPRLEIWFDRFTGYPQRKFWAGLYAQERPRLRALIKRLSENLWPVRTVEFSDTNVNKYAVLKTRLPRSEFNAPILEKYYRGYTFYGMYDPTRATPERVNVHFCSRAVAFFLDVVEAMPLTTDEEGRRDVYPQCENRTRVASHLRRDRSRLLATECKIRDNYECQVCGLSFAHVYGKLGVGYAEAHHRVPLSQLSDHVETRVSDLATVCANCHRMLHLMEGKRDDIQKLRNIVRRHGAG